MLKDVKQWRFLRAADSQLLRSLDHLLSEAAPRLAPFMACKLGCSHCCIGPFEITQLDAWRLRWGWQLLRESDLDRARTVLERAQAAWREMQSWFPGDLSTGILSAQEEALETFFEKFAHLPCPALDPLTQTCDLYNHRPLTCRTFGPPFLWGDDFFKPCPLCFQGWSEEELRRAAVAFELSALEEELVATAETCAGFAGSTVVAFVLGHPEQISLDPFGLR